MVKHKIHAQHSGCAADERLSIPLIKKAIQRALDLEGAYLPCEVSVVVTDDSAIRKKNNEFRGIDNSTDVLSFPMFEFSKPGWGALPSSSIDPETGMVPLGDIIISAAQTIRQAQEYGQTIERETAYLIVHSVLHLLGYDHIEGTDEKKKMRKREKVIMKGFKRGWPDTKM